ncbi:hypothetical protein BGZ73_005764 [Actinomortierella ambigua]|nr:hypothetical protein BGZ73_005764 [Actinomortierella ambigua]
MARGRLEPAHNDTTSNATSPQALALTLTQAAAAFRDADFFESAVLYWSAALAATNIEPIEEDQPIHESLLEFGFDLEQELGLDVQQQEPIELVYPPTLRTAAPTTATMLRQQQQQRLPQQAKGQDTPVDHGSQAPATDLDQQGQDRPQRHTIPLRRSTTPPLLVYIMSALAYLSRQINVRIDILPSGNDTLTSLGPPQRFYGTLSPAQQSLYHDLLAIVLATTSRHNQQLLSSTSKSHPSGDDHHALPPTTLLGNEVSSTWQIMIPQKRTPHSMPRFFSYLNPAAAATAAGCSIPRNELDIAALAESGVRLVITLIKETPLPQAWFPGLATTTSTMAQTRQPRRQPQRANGQGSSDENDSNDDDDETFAPSPPSTPLGRIQNAFVPIENLKAPAFPEVYEKILGWCVRTTAASSLPSTQSQQNRRQEHGEQAFLHPHQNAVLIHCGGGKGRAGIVLAAHLMRFGLAGHGTTGYCRQCLDDNNLHPYDLNFFHPSHRRRHQDGGSTSEPSQLQVLNALPRPCINPAALDADDHDSLSDEDDEDDGEKEASLGIDTTLGVYVVKPQHCVNRYTPKMTARDAMAYLRAIRPGSIETTIQEKSLKAYGDWLWKQAAKRRQRGGQEEAGEQVADHSENSATINETNHHTSTGRKDAKGKDKDRKSSAATSSAPQKPSHKAKQRQVDARVEDAEEDLSKDEGRRGGKKGKKQKQQQQYQETYKHAPPPPNKIIKLPSGGKGSHHQHHLIVQHNMRAKLQRGQKKNKDKNAKGAKDSGGPTSFRMTGTMLDQPNAVPPKLIVLTGLPGSGKSHLATRLLAAFPEHFVHICQDELGSRSVCERLVAQSMRHQQQSAQAKGDPTLALPMSVLIDRCNPTAADRKSWYETAFQPDETCLIWCSADQPTCLARCEARTNHPTLDPAKAGRVLKGFAREFERPSLGSEPWAKTLIEVGDLDGAETAFRLLADLASAVPGSSSSTPRTSTTPKPTRIPRPAFIPAKVLQRRNQQQSSGGSSSGAGAEGAGNSKTLMAGMDKVDEEAEEEDDEDETDGEHEGDEDDGAESEDRADEADDGPATTKGDAPSAVFDTSPLAKALQFASPTGHRPAVKKPARGSYRGNQLMTSKKGNQGGGGIESSENDEAPLSPSSKGVQFATPISSYARPMQKFPRTPHLMDPLTIRSALSLDATTSSSGERKRSPAISRNDLLLPTSALGQILHPKPHQVLTVEEKVDGANLGFSVVHFKPMSSEASPNSVLPPPKIRVQNRSHFVNSADHWQFKKLDQWLDRYRDDVLWLCEGRWRYETRDGRKLGQEDGAQQSESSPDEGDENGQHVQDQATPEEEKGEEEVVDDDDDDAWVEEEDEEEDKDEYVDEDRILQDGLAAYVLYGEWMYAKHSIQYTALDSWFVPFDLLDVKTGSFVSRKVFARALAQTQLRGPPQIAIPDHVRGDTATMVEWVLEQLESTSQLMRPEEEEEQVTKKKTSHGKATSPERRVEGLYFRIDQGHRLSMRCKVVRPDFIAGEERWGTKEQVANELKWDAYH